MTKTQRKSLINKNKICTQIETTWNSPRAKFHPNAEVIVKRKNRSRYTSKAQYQHRGQTGTVVGAAGIAFGNSFMSSSRYFVNFNGTVIGYQSDLLTSLNN